FSSTFSLDPAHFPYTKASVQGVRDRRKQLDNQLFFDLVLSEVAQVKSGSKYYPPKNIAELRALHDAIEQCPADLLKKQCCIYYILRDWGTHAEYAAAQLLPENYCALMDSYWLLDREQYDEAIKSLTVPTLTPNFMTKILETFTQAQRPDLIVVYVQTLQEPLDSPAKIDLYLSALLRIDVTRALFFTRTAPAALRQGLFEKSLVEATTTHQGAGIVANFPYEAEEEQWARALLNSGK
ncbi:ELYS-like domain-containing protein, partial [Protomyces lactucae-debilis]